MGCFRGGQKWPQPANKKLKTDIYIIFNRHLLHYTMSILALMLICKKRFKRNCNDWGYHETKILNYRGLKDLTEYLGFVIKGVSISSSQRIRLSWYFHQISNLTTKVYLRWQVLHLELMSTLYPFPRLLGMSPYTNTPKISRDKSLILSQETGGIFWKISGKNRKVYKIVKVVKKCPNYAFVLGGRAFLQSFFHE